ALGPQEIQTVTGCPQGPSEMGIRHHDLSPLLRSLGTGAQPADDQDDRSRVTGDCYARFYESPGARFPGAPRPDALFPLWRYHPFVTNSTLPTAEADLTRRRHAIIE